MNSEEIQQIFFVECEESLEAAESGLNACKMGNHDQETINAIFRAVHSIKGGAGAFGHTAMQTFTHCFETLLADVREGSVDLHQELVDLLLLALDCLRDHVDAARDGSDAPEDRALIEQLTGAQAVNQGSSNGQAAAETPTANGPDNANAQEDLDALLDDLMIGPASKDAGDQQPPGSEEASDWLVHFRPHAGAMLNGNEPLLWLRELAALGGNCIRCDLENLPILEEFDPEQGYLGWTFKMPESVSREAVEDIFDFAGETCSISFDQGGAIPPPQIEQTDPKPASTENVPVKNAPQPEPTTDQSSKAQKPTEAPPKRPSVAASQSVRVDLAKLDNLIDGVGELVIAQAMLTQRLANEGLAHIEELAMLDTLVRDIQEHAMAFRAQPISSVFSRVPRLLRELASSTGKHVKLNVSGEMTELDKTVIERLSEPMTHLIRNAVDHGIEPADERQAAGKDPEGTLSLSAEQKAGRIVIRIGDDGRGIDREKLRSKAIANGVISEDAQLSDEEINNLVFAAGLSTAKEVSNISGRGVGMDVVRQNVKDLGGRITIESRPGEGTDFILALPLTLAISDGMIVQVGEQSLVIPLAHVVESLRPNPTDLKGMGTQQNIINVRGQFVPIIPLNRLVEKQVDENPPNEGVLVVVDTEAHGQAALLVDAITDQRQFVIKSLDVNYRAVDSIAGATILGNGRVALIVDVDHLVQSVAQPRKLAAAA